MGTVRFSHRLDQTAISRLLTSNAGPVAREMLRRGLLVETQAKRNLRGVGGPRRIDTGRLWSSVHTALIFRNGAPCASVGTNVYYAIWVHDGTGIYGSRHQPIKPKRAKRLRFRPRGRGKYVYARQVSGMRPNPFLRNALPAARG